MHTEQPLKLIKYSTRMSIHSSHHQYYAYSAENRLVFKDLLLNMLSINHRLVNSRHKNTHGFLVFSPYLPYIKSNQNILLPSGHREWKSILFVR